MKALVLQGIKDLAVQEYDIPEIKPDEVLIHTAYAGICGTDKALYAGLLLQFHQSYLATKTLVS